MSATKTSASPSSGDRTTAPAARTAPAPALVQRLGNQGLQRLLRARRLQAKLTVGSPRDVYEQEADRVADQVLRMPEPALPDGGEAAGSVAPSPARVARTSDDVGGRADGATAASEVPAIDPTTERAIRSLPGRGNPLPDSVRAYMEPRFRADFSAVRIHDDSDAHALARSVNAQAFTVGRDVVFGAGYFAPESVSGRRLLAHELTHVVQQSAAPRATPNALSRRASHGAPPPAATRSPATAVVQRAPATKAAPAPSAPWIPAPAGKVGFVSQEGLNLRAGPNETFASLARLRFGTRVHTVDDPSPTPSWHRVAAVGKTGYVFAPQVLFPRDDVIRKDPGLRLITVRPGMTFYDLVHEVYGIVGDELDADQNINHFINAIRAVNKPEAFDVKAGIIERLKNRALSGREAKNTYLKANYRLWIPSFDVALHADVGSGTVRGELRRVVRRVGQKLADFGAAAARSTHYMADAVKTHAGEVAGGVLSGLLDFALDAAKILGASTAIGAILGGLLGVGAGALPGAEIGFEIGLLILDIYGLSMLVEAIVDLAVGLVLQLGKFVQLAWEANGDPRQIDLAGRALAEALGILVGGAVFAIIAYVQHRGFEALRKTKFAQKIGENRLAKWLKDRGELKTTGEKLDKFLDKRARAKARRQAGTDIAPVFDTSNATPINPGDPLPPGLEWREVDGRLQPVPRPGFAWFSYGDQELLLPTEERGAPKKGAPKSKRPAGQAGSTTSTTRPRSPARRAGASVPARRPRPAAAPKKPPVPLPPPEAVPVPVVPGTDTVGKFTAPQVGSVADGNGVPVPVVPGTDTTGTFTPPTASAADSNGVPTPVNDDVRSPRDRVDDPSAVPTPVADDVRHDRDRIDLPVDPHGDTVRIPAPVDPRGDTAPVHDTTPNAAPEPVDPLADTVPVPDTAPVPAPVDPLADTAPVESRGADPAAPVADADEGSTAPLVTTPGERIGKFTIYGVRNVEADGKVVHRVVTGLNREGGRQTERIEIKSLLELFDALVEDARKSGAERLRMTGAVVRNPNVLRIDRLAKLYDGSARQTGPTTIELDLPVTGRKSRAPASVDGEAAATPTPSRTTEEPDGLSIFGGRRKPPKGPKGPKGPKDPEGPKGPKDPEGPKGPDDSEPANNEGPKDREPEAEDEKASGRPPTRQRRNTPQLPTREPTIPTEGPNAPERLLELLEQGVDRTLPEPRARVENPPASGLYRRGITSPIDAYHAFNEAVVRSAGREVAVYYDLNSGEYAIVIGNATDVPFPPAELFPQAEWLPVVHLHPVPEGAALIFRWPSVADFDVLWDLLLERRLQRARAFVETDIPSVGRARLEYGIDRTHSEPFYLIIRHADGRVEPPRRFKSLPEYQHEYDSRTKAILPGTPAYEKVIPGRPRQGVPATVVPTGGAAAAPSSKITVDLDAPGPGELAPARPSSGRATIRSGPARAPLGQPAPKSTALHGEIDATAPGRVGDATRAGDRAFPGAFADQLAREPGSLFSPRLDPIRREGVDRYNRGEIGNSVRDLDVRGKTADRLDAELLARGFRRIDGVLRDFSRDRNNPTIRMDANGNPVAQRFYVHPDGGMVRVKPSGDPGNPRRPQPNVSKSVRNPPDAPVESFANEACKVTNDGIAIPASPADLFNPYPRGTPEHDHFADHWADVAHTDI